MKFIFKLLVLATATILFIMVFCWDVAYVNAHGINIQNCLLFAFLFFGQLYGYTFVWKWTFSSIYKWLALTDEQRRQAARNAFNAEQEKARALKAKTTPPPRLGLSPNEIHIKLSNTKNMKQFIFICLSACALVVSCDVAIDKPHSSSGVEKATVKVTTDLQGHTTEQNNIVARYQMDNQPGSIKHLYVISSMTGDVMMYSTVKGKVTSSGKRLTPSSVVGINAAVDVNNNLVDIGGKSYATNEMIQDDGTYGSSMEYLYWFDSRGVYHQIYPTGGSIITISNQPLPIKKIAINLEMTAENQQP